ncbi:MAG: amino acid permease [Legionella sp.]
MLNSKLIGGILLIVGTSIGGGMLALPVATAAAGLGNTIMFLIACWLIMTLGALLILEVNLRLPPGSNMVSMAKATIGWPGQIIAWIIYLFLLYSLLAAYISGGSDIFNALLIKIHISLPSHIAAVLFTSLFSIIIYGGIAMVDYVNRGLMFAKLAIYLLLVLIISPYVKTVGWFESGSAHAIAGSLMLLVSSFGFASIVPSLREYFNGEVDLLRKAILLGSLIPLICYIIWEAVIIGVVHREGPNGLLGLMNSNHPTSGLNEIIRTAVNNRWISSFFNLFTSVCMLTAFLGVALGLFDFLADGLNLKKSGKQGKLVLAFTFIPPLTITFINPAIYLQALNYAGICCVLLLLLLPTIMAWRGRKIPSLATTFTLPGQNLTLIAIGLSALILLLCG